MQTIKEIGKINCELAQLRNAINKIPTYKTKNSHDYDLEWIYQRTNSSGKKVLATKSMEIHHPDLIGDTAIHIVLRRYGVCKILLDAEVYPEWPQSTYLYKPYDEGASVPFSEIVDKQYNELNIFSDPRYRLPHSLICSMLKIHKDSQNIANLSDKNKISYCHIACMANCSEIVQFYLNNKVDVNHAVSNDSPHFPGWTPLHFAVRCCSVQTVKLLFEHNANSHLKDAQGVTALQILLQNYIKFTLVTRSHIRQLKGQLEYLGKNRSKPMSSDDKFILNHGYYAEDYLMKKSEEIIRLFLEKYSQENILYIDEWGLSYIHIVSMIGDISLVNSKDVADINRCINMDSPLWPGYSPLHFVVLLCDIDTVKRFIEKGADMGVKDANGITPFDMCVNRFNRKDIHMLLSLHPTWKDIVLSDDKTKLLDILFAMQSESDLKIFIETLSNSIEIFIPHNSPLWPGFTLMHLLIIFAKNNMYYLDLYRDYVSYSSSYYKLERTIKRILHQSHNTVSAQRSCVSSLLNFAFCRKKKHTVKILLSLYESLGDYTDEVNDNQLSCLHIACAMQYDSLVKKLLSSGNDVNVVYKGQPFDSVNTGWTPLHFTVTNWNFTVLSILSKHSPNFLARDLNGMTPIHILLVIDKYKLYDEISDQYNFEELFSLSNYEDAVVDDIGLSHLHVACFLGYEVAVKELLKRGANINQIINYKPKTHKESTILSGLTKLDGSTPLYLALQQENKDIVRLLLENGADVFMKSCDNQQLFIWNILQNHYESLYNLDSLFLKVLVQKEDLQKHVERVIGLTKLHIACKLDDVKLVEELLNEGADVNAQIHTNSPIWSGYTPLHMLNYRAWICNSLDFEIEMTPIHRILNLLLDRKANVTLYTSAKGKTPIHMAYEEVPDRNSKYKNYVYVNILLRAQRDFSINPKSIDGLTHFHIACSLNDIFIVNKFLRHAKIDVNQRIEYFIGAGNNVKDDAGCTPLHLAVSNRTPHAHSAGLEIVDLLLNHGADVLAEDVNGNTPLHKAAECNEKCQDLLERLARSGAALNSRNILGKTPLENLILKKDDTFFTSSKLTVTAEEIKYFLKNGCHFNDYNPATGKGYLALAISHLSYEEMLNLIAAIRINYPNVMKIKYKGRTVIHNIVSARVTNISSDDYAALINQLSKFDCDIDDQDEQGQTALHLAVHHQNALAVDALKSNGVDISIHDSSGKAAFAYNKKSCHECANKTSQKCDHALIKEYFTTYILRLQLCRSYKMLLCEFLDYETIARDHIDCSIGEASFAQLEKTQCLKIGSSLITFKDFLSENSAVIVYSTMSEMGREAIDDYFLLHQHPSSRTEYAAVSDIIHFQYRKAVKRRNLINPSKKALIMLAGFSLPDFCSEFMLQFLANTDLENLIASTV